MNVQSEVNFVGMVLPLVLDFAGLIPGVAEARNAITLVEDGIKIEETAYSLLMSPAGAPVLAAMQDFFGRLGINMNLVAEECKLAIAPADWDSPVREAEDDSPYSGNEMGTGDDE